MVDLGSPTSGGGQDGKNVIHAAPVVHQWYESLHRPQSALLVLDIGVTRRDRTTPASQICESFPLSLRLTDRDVIEAVRGRVEEAERALGALQAACVRLHMKTRPSARLGKAQSTRARKEKELVHDVTATFWQRTEAAFWRAYDAAIGKDERASIEAEDVFGAAVRKTALELFDAHASPSIADPSRVAVLAEVRARLSAALPHSMGSARTSTLPDPIADGVPPASKPPHPHP